MSTVFEPVVSDNVVAKNGKSNGNGTGTSRGREIKPIGLNGQKVVGKRYSLKDAKGDALETWSDIARRVVGHVSRAEQDPGMRDYFYNSMLEIMLNREFIPNTPCLVNAGKPKGQLAACFVLHVPDSIEGIMEHAQAAAIIHQTGGGTGMTYEFLRPAGAMVNSTRGVASGPVSFMNIVNTMTEVVKQGGVRRGANMGMMRCLSGDTMIHTLEGRFPIKELVGQNPYIYACDPETKKTHVIQAQAVFVSDRNRKMVRVWMDNDEYIDCTPDHRFLLSNGKYKEAQELSLGDSLMAFSKSVARHGSESRYIKYIGNTGSRSVPEHQIVAKDILGETPNIDRHVHHIDGDSLNNHPFNLQMLSRREHGQEHAGNLVEHQRRIAGERRGRKLEEIYGKEKATEWKAKMSASSWMKKKAQTKTITNHKVVKVEIIGVAEVVYDMTVPVFHNFVANGVFVHNCTHPDILRFVHAKNDQHSLTNFNISVNVTDNFLESVDNKEWFQTEFDGEAWAQPIFDAVTGTDYVVYRRPNGETVTFADKLAFENADLSDCAIEEPPQPGMIYAPDIWNRIIASAHKYAEPGIAFIDEVNRHNHMTASMGPIYASNPCITGETLVAAADGRGNVPIRELAEEGKDVPVYALNERGGLVVRTMRNPRITGYEPVYKVTLDDGSIIRATANHKLLIRGGGYKRVDELQKGDSLHIMTRFHSSLHEMFPTDNAPTQDYVWLNNGGQVTDKAEHRLIAQFHQNLKRILKGHIVHHKDFNGRNNRPENLQIMSIEDHNRLHGDLMMGANNPMVRAKTEWSAEKWAAYRQNMSNAVSGENFDKSTEPRLHELEKCKNCSPQFKLQTYEKEIEFACNCSFERAVSLIGSLGRGEVEAMLKEDKGAKMTCGFCNELYTLDENDLRKML